MLHFLTEHCPIYIWNIINLCIYGSLIFYFFWNIEEIFCWFSHLSFGDFWNILQCNTHISHNKFYGIKSQYCYTRQLQLNRIIQIRKEEEIGKI